jgi:hypothetical protein
VEGGGWRGGRGQRAEGRGQRAVGRGGGLGRELKAEGGGKRERDGERRERVTLVSKDVEEFIEEMIKSSSELKILLLVQVNSQIL